MTVLAIISQTSTKDGAEQGGVYQGTPDAVPLEHGHHIGDDEADV